MIYLITGLPGSGKSLYTLKFVDDLATKENRPVYYNGIPELTRNWTLLEDPKTWFNLPKGSIIVIDECQTTFRPRGNGSAVPDYVAHLETHRHNGHDLFLITQHPMLLDGNVRRLVGRHYHSVRFYGFQKATVHEFQQVRDNADKSLKGSIAHHFVYPKEVFNWYKSADMHTMKKRLPLRLFMIILLPIFLIAVIYYFVTTVLALKDPAVNAPQTQTDPSKPNANTTNQPPVDKKNYHLSTLEYVELEVPRLEGLQYTARKYDDLTVPNRVPVPAGCMKMRDECNCYTQDGTKLTMEKPLCEHIVKNGLFIDFDPDPNKKEYNAPQLANYSNNGVIRGGTPDVDPTPFRLSNDKPLRASPNNAPAS